MAEINFNSLTLRVYYMCTALLGIKMLLMAVLTARLRFKKKIFISPEDKVFLKNSQVSTNNPDIERVRRAHRNDLENIPIFICLGSIYAMMAPNPLIAGLLFVAYTLSRFAHTYVYVIKVTPQPARFLCFAMGYVINMYFAGYIMYHTGIV